jgi:hypothetical protein
MISDQYDMEERKAEEDNMKNKFLKAHKKGKVTELFTYSGKNYIDGKIKRKGLLRLRFSSEGEKVDFLEKENIECCTRGFPDLPRVSTTAKFMESYRRHRIRLSDVDHIGEFKNNYTVYFVSDGFELNDDNKLIYVSLKKVKNEDGDFVKWMNLLIKTETIGYNDYR